MRSRSLTRGVPAAVVATAVSALLLGACGSPADVTASRAATAPAGTTAGAAEPDRPRPAPQSQVPAGRWALGDSVMLGALPALESHGFRALAKESRQFGYAVDAVTRRAQKGTLPRNVVVHLGTNGTIDDSDCRAVVDAVGPERRLFLVTVRVPRPWQASNNRELRACAATAPDRVVVLDWHAVSADHPQWFYDDGIHLRPVGQEAYAAFVADQVARLGL